MGIKNYNLGHIHEEVTKEIFDVFSSPEGTNNLYYGRVRNGKTYSATADIIDLLKRGEIVYANWLIKFDDYDERSSFWISLVKFFGGRKYFYNFKASNFHYFDPDQIDVAFLGRLVGVHVFIDEGQWLFNSHIREKADDPVAIEKRKLILHGGHYCRSLNVITQRPTNVFKDIRSQINVWYKCEKRFSFGRFILFQRWRIEDMKDDLPDEENPVGRPKTYIGDTVIFNAYNTHGMRADDAIEVATDFDVYELTFKDRLLLLLKHLLPSMPRFKRGMRAKSSKNVVLSILFIKVKNLLPKPKLSPIEVVVSSVRSKPSLLSSLPLKKDSVFAKAEPAPLGFQEDISKLNKGRFPD